MKRKGKKAFTGRVDGTDFTAEVKATNQAAARHKVKRKAEKAGYTVHYRDIRVTRNYGNDGK